MELKTRQRFNRSIMFVFGLFLFFPTYVLADVVINVLAVNGSDKAVEKDIEFSLPGEIKPEDVTDPAGLVVDYSVNDVGYFLHGKVLLQGKETKTLRVKVKDIWQITNEQVNAIKEDIEQGYKEMGSERSKENGDLLKTRLFLNLDRILQEQASATNSIDNRIDTYRNYIQTLESIKSKAHLIDFWRTDANEIESNKTITLKVETENKAEKSKKVKERYFLPTEVLPEYVVDRKGYEVRFDQKKNQPFLFKEEDFAAKEKRSVSFSIKDVWNIPSKEMEYIRERAKHIEDALKRSKLTMTATALYNNITNYLDLISALQAIQQPDIQQHIGAFRVNKERFSKAKVDLDSLEKLLSRHRAELEKSKIKNIMQKMQTMKSLARVSQAIFDKKPTVNAAWKIIGSVMLFLGLFTIIHFVTWIFRSSKEKKQEALKQKENDQKKE